MENLFTTIVLLCLVPLGSSRRLLQSSSFNVVTYGAVGDGKTNDGEAFQKAWTDVCGASDTPTLEIPSGKTFLLQAVEFEGPCKSSSIHVSLLGDIIAPEMNAWTGNKEFWIGFSHVDGLVLDGQGKIDGQGGSWWPCVHEELTGNNKDCQRPTALHFLQCNGLQINGITSMNSPKNHISVTETNGATISNAHLIAPKDSPNTDGLDISSSSNVYIHDSTIATGDDCVAINSPASFINITNVECGPGHGISVGSLGKNGENAQVEEIHVTGCNFTETQNGVRIKTFADGTGYARKISFEQITFKDVENPILVDQYYCDDNDCGSGQESKIQLSDITYRGIHGTTVDTMAIVLNCTGSAPCTNIRMDDINIVATNGGSTTAVCENAQGSQTSTNPSVTCLTESVDSLERKHQHP